MRYDETKAFPHPVLRQSADDYLDGAFQATVKCDLNKKATRVDLSAVFLNSEKALQELIKKGDAAYALLVDSRETYFRDLITTAETKIKRSYDGGKLKGTVIISPYIVAKNDIPNFQPKNLNSEFDGLHFDIKTGDVIAVETPRELWVGYELMAPIGSVFELVEDENLSIGVIKLGLDDDKVQILVSPEQKKMIDAARGQALLRAVLLNGIYLPVLIEVLRYMAKASGDYENYSWYRAISVKCDADGIELNDDTDTLAVAQKLMKYPLNALNKGPLGASK